MERAEIIDFLLKAEERKSKPPRKAEFMASPLEKKRQSLETLSDEELQAEYEKTLRSFQKDLGPDANYAAWADEPSWEWEEVEILFFGKEPNEQFWATVTDYSGYVPEAGDMLKARERLRRVRKKHKLDDITPYDFLQLCRKENLPLPKAVRLAIETKALGYNSEDEASYTTPYLELMKRAIVANNITADNQPKKETLVQWFKDEAPETIRKADGTFSDNLAAIFATAIRLPSSQVGGYLIDKKLKK